LPSDSTLQQAGLQFGRHVADFIEEERAVVGLLEASPALCAGAREGTLFVAEEFGFEQVARNRGGIDGDEGCILARAVAVQCARHEFLAGAGLAVDQHRGMGCRQPADGAEDFLQRSALPEDFRHGAGFKRGTIVVRRLGNRPTHQIYGLVYVERFGQIFEGTALEGCHGGIEVRVRGHDDDRQVRMIGLGVAQQVESAAAGHADVGDQHLRHLSAVERRQCFVRRAEALGRDAFTAERLFQHPADGAVVVDDPDGIHGLPPGDMLFIILPSSFWPAAASTRSRCGRGAM
jgi:hypothetical protein